MLPQRLAFIDLETTGLSVTRDRIIEIGILRVENNQIVNTYETLINPNRYLPPIIENITGISHGALQDAPLFEDIQEKVQELLEDTVFVAHNARFDYGFLHTEFQRCGIKFSPKHLCTAKLSRRLFPKEKRHSLDSIIERFQLVYKQRHRAFEDAKMLWHFFQAIQKQIPLEKLEQVVSVCMKKPSLPVHISEKMVNNLPESPGVYIFYGDNDVPLYVGKSINIKDRVLSHFSSDHSSSKEMNLSQQVRFIEALPTAGELGALIKESALVKKLQPIYNRQLRISRKLQMIKKSENAEGYATTNMQTVSHITPDDLQDIVGIFRSQQQVKDFLIEQSQKYQLCEKLLGLEKTKGACFGYRLEKCKGACMQEEKAIAYNMRFIQAFSAYKIKAWAFNGPIVIKEISEDTEEAIVVDKWCLIKSIDEETPLFDLDIYKILVRYVFDPKNQKNIINKPLNI